MAAGVTIRHKRKASAFLDGDLGLGELGIDTTNAHLYLSADGVNVVPVIGSSFLVSHTTTSASYTAGSNGETVIFADATNNAITVTLPAAANSLNRQFSIKKIDGSSNDVTLDGNGTETIDDTTIKIIENQYDSLTLICDGTQWWII